MRRSRDTFTGNLFESEKLEEFDENGNQINPDTGEIVKEAPSPALLMAREMYGRQGNSILSDNELNRLGYVRACKQELAERSQQAQRRKAAGR